LPQAAQPILLFFTRVGTYLFDAGCMLAQYPQERPHRHPRTGLHSEVRKQIAIESIIVALLRFRLVQLVQDILALAIGLQVLTGKADLICSQNKLDLKVWVTYNLFRDRMQRVTIRVWLKLDAMSIGTYDVDQMMWS
jgi:hypothetical protein